MGESEPPTLAQQVRQASEFIAGRIGARPSVGIILGSGLAALTSEVGGRQVVPYRDIPHFPQTGVHGHARELIAGELWGCRAAVLSGRAHYYEGHTMAQVTLPVRVLHALGCRVLVVTNAAGGLNSYFWPGDLMLITDHINLPGMAGLGPLGCAEEDGSRFVDMADAYDPWLRELAMGSARAAGVTLRQGVYAMVAGPSFETPAERAWLQSLGADAVGMSTAPEVVVARQLGVRVLGISCIANLALGPQWPHATTHTGVLARAEAAVPMLVAVLNGVLRELLRSGDLPKEES